LNRRNQSKFSEPLQNLVDIYLSKKMYSSAVDILLEEIEYHEEKFECVPTSLLYEMTIAQILLGDFDEAMDSIRQANCISNKWTTLIGYLHWKKGKWDEAFSCFHKVKATVEGCLMAGYFFIDKKLYQDAFISIKRAVQYGIYRQMALNLLFHLYIKTKSYTAAREVLNSHKDTFKEHFHEPFLNLVNLEDKRTKLTEVKQMRSFDLIKGKDILKPVALAYKGLFPDSIEKSPYVSLKTLFSLYPAGGNKIYDMFPTTSKCMWQLCYLSNLKMASYYFLCPILKSNEGESSLLKYLSFASIGHTKPLETYLHWYVSHSNDLQTGLILKLFILNRNLKKKIDFKEGMEIVSHIEGDIVIEKCKFFLQCMYDSEEALKEANEFITALPSSMPLLYYKALYHFQCGTQIHARKAMGYINKLMKNIEQPYYWLLKGRIALHLGDTNLVHQCIDNLMNESLDDFEVLSFKLDIEELIGSLKLDLAEKKNEEFKLFLTNLALDKAELYLSFLNEFILKEMNYYYYYRCKIACYQENFQHAKIQFERLDVNFKKVDLPQIQLKMKFMDEWNEEKFESFHHEMQNFIENHVYSLQSQLYITYCYMLVQKGYIIQAKELLHYCGSARSLIYEKTFELLHVCYWTDQHEKLKVLIDKLSIDLLQKRNEVLCLFKLVTSLYTIQSLISGDSFNGHHKGIQEQLDDLQSTCTDIKEYLNFKFDLHVLEKYQAHGKIFKPLEKLYGKLKSVFKHYSLDLDTLFSPQDFPQVEPQHPFNEDEFFHSLKDTIVSNQSNIQSVIDTHYDQLEPIQKEFVDMIRLLYQGDRVDKVNLRRILNNFHHATVPLSAHHIEILLFYSDILQFDDHTKSMLQFVLPSGDILNQKTIFHKIQDLKNMEKPSDYVEAIEQIKDKLLNCERDSMAISILIQTHILIVKNHPEWHERESIELDKINVRLPFTLNKLIKEFSPTNFLVHSSQNIPHCRDSFQKKYKKFQSSISKVFKAIERSSRNQLLNDLFNANTIQEVATIAYEHGMDQPMTFWGTFSGVIDSMKTYLKLKQLDANDHEALMVLFHAVFNIQDDPKTNFILSIQKRISFNTCNDHLFHWCIYKELLPHAKSEIEKGALQMALVEATYRQPHSIPEIIYNLFGFRHAPIKKTQKCLGLFGEDISIQKMAGVRWILRYLYRHRSITLEDIPFQLLPCHILQLAPFLPFKTYIKMLSSLLHLSTGLLEKIHHLFHSCVSLSTFKEVFCTLFRWKKMELFVEGFKVVDAFNNHIHFELILDDHSLFLESSMNQLRSIFDMHQDHLFGVGALVYRRRFIPSWKPSKSRFVSNQKYQFYRQLQLDSIQHRYINQLLGTHDEDASCYLNEHGYFIEQPSTACFGSPTFTMKGSEKAPRFTDWVITKLDNIDHVNWVFSCWSAPKSLPCEYVKPKQFRPLEVDVVIEKEDRFLWRLLNNQSTTVQSNSAALPLIPQQLFSFASKDFDKEALLDRCLHLLAIQRAHL